MKGNTAEISLSIHHGSLDRALQNELIKFWLDHKVLNEQAANERIKEVLILARSSNGKIIAVFTYALKHIPLLRNYMYLIRLFVSPSNHSAFLTLRMARLAYDFLKEKSKTEPTKPLGLFALIQNNKMARKWNWAVWPKLPFTYIGSTNSGHQRRVLYFDKYHE